MADKRREENRLPEQAAPGVPKLAFTMKEAAQAVGVSYITMHRFLRRGLIRSSTASKRKIIPRAELDRFLATLN